MEIDRADAAQGGDRHAVTDEAGLLDLYGRPAQASLTKETDRLTPAYRRLIEAAPFVVLASLGPDGLDASPRGDAPGFVRVLDERTLALPDRRGNNRLDTLRNLVVDPRVALLFLVPGVDETLRLNGRATITTDPALLESFAVDGKAPATVLRIEIETVYFQCARALIRSKLWQPEARAERKDLPSAGAMLKGARGDFDADAYDADLPERQGATLY